MKEQFSIIKRLNNNYTRVVVKRKGKVYVLKVKAKK